ncbi:MAG: PA0069 family radical SAM protein [Bacteroidetes bacterium]|nr:PA0069 family radical SAM protein [Bacteroidota bacterium]MCY4205051.1 PA0069 family radical SAM protein [Bacteroidota bacterium]
MTEQQGLIPAPKGRATATNPPTRFDPVKLELDLDALDPGELRQSCTQFYEDTSRSILVSNDSPDVGFSWGINPYRGCEHGCIYCYARPSHEYLGWSAGLDFETKILIKRNAPELLSKELRKRSWKPAVVSLSGNTDPYQPAERRLELTRGCLKILSEHRNPVVIITKNHLVTRDLDILAPMAKRGLIQVMISVTTLRNNIASVMEPRTSMPVRRLDAIEKLSEEGIPTGVMVAPVVPGLTDEELPAILEAAADRGAFRAGYILLRLPGPVAPLFEDWLDRVMPERKDKIITRIKDVRSGQLNDPRFGHRMRGEGVWAQTLSSLFQVTCKRHKLNLTRKHLRTDLFIRHPSNQLNLFEPDDFNGF